MGQSMEYIDLYNKTPLPATGSASNATCASGTTTSKTSRASFVNEQLSTILDHASVHETPVLIISSPPSRASDTSNLVIKNLMFFTF